MAIRATISTNIPSDPDRKTRSSVRAAVTEAAKTHHQRHMPWHFEEFAPQKYGYRPRSTRYLDLKHKLGLPLNNSLVFSGQTRNEILTSATITATGTRGAQLKMKCSILGMTTGRTLDIAAIERILKAESNRHDRSRLSRLLERLKKSGGRLTVGQEESIRRNAELTAIASDEIRYLARVEEKVFKTEINKPEPMRTAV